MKAFKPMVGAALLLAAGCQDSPSTAPAPEYNPEEAATVDHALCLLGYTAVPLRQVSPGHHLVDATINGETGSFVLDTGANVTVIDEARAELFGITPSSGGVAGLGGVSVPAGAGRASQTRIDSFTIGAVSIRQDQVVTTDLGQLLGALGQVAGVEVPGLIGQDVLTEHRAIIDVARPMLYLMDADREPAPVPAERCSGEPAAAD